MQCLNLHRVKQEMKMYTWERLYLYLQLFHAAEKQKSEKTGGEKYPSEVEEGYVSVRFV